MSTEENRRTDSPSKGPMRGVPDDQTPATTGAGHYTGDSPDKKKSQESQQSEESDVEGSPNQGTESR